MNLGPTRTLDLYGPLLQHPARNSKATVITLFHDAAAEMPDDKHLPTPESTNMLLQLLPMDRSEFIRGQRTAKLQSFANAYR